MYVVTVPTTDSNPHPTDKDLRNLRAILTNIEKLRCDMYDNALIPVALVNKLVSLANHPSTRILQKFAVDTMGHLDCGRAARPPGASEPPAHGRRRMLPRTGLLARQGKP